MNDECLEPSDYDLCHSSRKAERRLPRIAIEVAK